MSSISLSPEQIERMLLPYLNVTSEVPPQLFEQLSKYLELLIRWNGRTNLTSIREPEQVVLRHFGESLSAGGHLANCTTLLDFGSGAGFPGVPIQLLRPNLRVTLAESQNKKATFLREVVRSLGLATEIWAARVEAMPPGRVFDVVALRAVDDMETALKEAALRAASNMLVLSTRQPSWQVPAGFDVVQAVLIPNSQNGQIFILDRTERWRP